QPSTPAERAPLLPRTRDHATTSVARSHTRLCRSKNLRLGSSDAHLCSLRWVPSTRTAACSADGHDAPLFSDDLLAFQTCAASPLLSSAMWSAFPTSDYSESSAPAQCHQRTPRLACPHGARRHRTGSHVHCLSVGGSVPSFSPAGLSRRYHSTRRAPPAEA